jgi:hypothetical protein
MDRRRFLAGGAAASAAALVRPPRAEAEAAGARVSTLAADGGHLDWLKLPGGPIVFDRIGPRGVFELWAMNADGGAARNLSAGHAQFAGVHVGQPAWHPSGRWIVFQAQKPGVPARYDSVSRPGAGVFNDLWVMRAGGCLARKLVDLPYSLSRDARGVLHPHFSPDGRRLIWAERIAGGRQPFGVWTMRIADVREEGEALRLGAVVAASPRGDAFYETHGFAPDGRSFLFSSDGDRGLQLYVYDLASGAARQLTRDPRVWSEHAHFSPDGRWILHISSEGLVFRARPDFELETEFWLMRPDGSERRRLTYFHQPGHPHHRAGFAVAADAAWRRDGRAFAGLVIRHRPVTPRRGRNGAGRARLNGGGERRAGGRMLRPVPSGGDADDHRHHRVQAEARHHAAQGDRDLQSERAALCRLPGPHPQILSLRRG